MCGPAGGRQRMHDRRQAMLGRAPMPKKWPFRRRRSRSFTVPRELEGSDRCYCSRAENLIMCVHSKSASVMFRGVALALAVLFYVGDAAAQNNATVGSAPSTDPFAQLAGSWSGSGTIDLSNGRHEPIKCRASYDVLEEQSKLQLDIRCASDNYNFNLRASATYAAGAITGVWSEFHPQCSRNLIRQGRGRRLSGRGQGTDIYRQSESGNAR